MTAAPLTMHVDRERVMDFTYPFYHAFTTVLIRNARKWRTLIDPFKWQVLVSVGELTLESA